MAFDELQLPAVVINNNKLISMAGNLMAKKKAEEAATQKALTDEMAKLDASKIRYPDVKTWNVKYENLLSAGTNASKNPTDIKSQIQYKTALNEAKSWLVGNNYIKENFDVPNVKVAYDSDYNDNDRADAKNKTLLTQEEILASEPKLYNKKDKEDYMLKIANAFSPSVFAQDDKFRYKNDLSRSYNQLKAASDLHAMTNLETETGAKALAEIATGLKVDLGTPAGAKLAKQKYADTIWKLVQPNLKGDVENLPEDNSLNIGIGGLDPKRASLVKSRVEEMFQIRLGNPKAIDRLKQRLGPDSDVKFIGDKLVIKYKAKAKDQYGNDILKDEQFSTPASASLGDFYLGLNSAYDSIDNMGNATIANEEITAFINDKTQNKWITPGKRFVGSNAPPFNISPTKPVVKPAAKPTTKAVAKPIAKGKAASKGGKVTNVQNIFGTTTPTPVKPGP
jgi:hypothetical protein